MKNDLVVEFEKETPREVYAGTTPFIRISKRGNEGYRVTDKPLPFPAHTYRVMLEFKHDTYGSYLFTSKANAERFAVEKGFRPARRVGI